jgi:hypothetical protein
MDRIKLPEGKDRRVKLSAQQKKEIYDKYYNRNVEYENGTKLYSLNKLAREYGVSKKLILLIVNAESKEKNDEYIKNHWKQYRWSKDKMSPYIRKFREYKKECFYNLGIKTVEDAKKAGLINNKRLTK